MIKFTGDTDRIRRFLADNGPSTYYEIREKVDTPNLDTLLSEAKDIHFIGTRRVGFWCLESQIKEAGRMYNSKKELPPAEYLELVQQKWTPRPLYRLRHGILSVLYKNEKLNNDEIANQLHIPKVRWDEANSQYGITYCVFGNLKMVLKNCVDEKIIIRESNRRGRYLYSLSDSVNCEELPARIPVGVTTILFDYLTRDGYVAYELLSQLEKIAPYNYSVLLDYLGRPKELNLTTIPIEILEFLISKLPHYSYSELDDNPEYSHPKELKKALEPFKFDSRELYVPCDVVYLPTRGHIGVVTGISNGEIDTATVRILGEYGGRTVRLVMNEKNRHPNSIPKYC